MRQANGGALAFSAGSLAMHNDAPIGDDNKSCIETIITWKNTVIISTEMIRKRLAVAEYSLRKVDYYTKVWSRQKSVL